MEKTLKQLIEDIQKVYKEYQNAQYTPCKPSMYQTRDLHIRHLSKKLRFLQKKVSYLVNKPGTKVVYAMGERTFEATFLSLSKEDTIAYLNLMALVKGFQLEILEISKIESEIRELNL